MSPTKTQKDSTYAVAVIGAGHIGSSWDTPDSRHILTYAHAFTAHPRTRLIGLVDADADRGTSEAAKWQTAAYADVAALLAKEQPDIIVIATPDATHAAMLESVLESDTKLVICEKPVVTNDAEAGRVRKALAATAVPVIVNFPRRFDARVTRLRDELAGGAHGAVISARATYAKGTHHIGSHLFDLLRYLFGDMAAAAAHFKIDDYPNDPTYAGVATFETCREVHVQAMDGRSTSELELDIFTDTKRIRLTDRGYSIETQEIVADPMFAGFRMFGPVTREATELENAFPALAEHAVAVLDGAEPARAGAEDALKTFETCRRFASTYKPI